MTKVVFQLFLVVSLGLHKRVTMCLNFNQTLHFWIKMFRFQFNSIHIGKLHSTSKRKILQYVQILSLQ